MTAAHMVDVLAGRGVDRPQPIIIDGRITAVGRQGEALARTGDVGATAAGCHSDIVAVTTIYWPTSALDHVAVFITGGEIVKQARDAPTKSRYTMPRRR